MAEIKRPRRYYLLRRRYYVEREDDPAMATLWQGKQEGEPGTALPSAFICHASLAAAGYSTVEDLDGADADELTSAGFRTQEADAILSALSTIL